MAAMIISAIDQQAANAGSAHLGEGDLLRPAGKGGHGAIEAQPPIGGKLGFQINARVSKR
jgi:hypothetical protein